MHKSEISIFRTISSVLVILIALVGYVRAGVFIRQEEKKEAVYHHGNVEPESTTAIELWIGKENLAHKRGNIELLIDKTKGKAFVLNHGTKTFAETSLPFQIENVADEEFAPRLKMFRTQGEIRALNKERKIGDRVCSLMEITTWIIFEENRFYETDTEACLATDLPFDLKTAHDLLKEIQGLRNFDEGIYKEMVTLEGFPIETSSTQYMEGIAIPSRMQTLEMTIKEAPPGTYTIPDGFTKKEKLTRAELTSQ